MSYFSKPWGNLALMIGPSGGSEDNCVVQELEVRN